MRTPVFEGACTALVTPFRDGKLDLETMHALLERQYEHGIRAVCVCGTTGESATLRDDEKRQLIEFCVTQCKGRMKIIAGTGSNDTAHAVSLSIMAAELGADAVLAVTPYYNKATPDGLIAHFTAIADAAICPVILYNVPSRTGVNIPLDVYRVLQRHPNIAGVKEASGDVSYALHILANARNGFTLWSGNDDLITALSALGGKGVISVLANVCPTETAAICSACLDGDYAYAASRQQVMADLIDALFCEVNPIPVKTALNLMGLPVGNARLPLCEMREASLGKLKAALIAHDLI